MGSHPDERRADRLAVLLEVSKELGAGIELVPLLERVEQAALRVLDCERATVFLYDSAADELYSVVATGVANIRFPANRGIAGHAAHSGSIVNVPDAYADDRFNREVDRQTGYRTRNILAFPLNGYDGRMVGVLQALNKRNGAFTLPDEELAATLSSLAGVAVQRQMLLDQYAEKQRLERDLDVARDIQMSLLPKTNPQVPGYDIAGWNEPADQTGGDAYDFVDLEAGRCGLMLADATGHGIGPALVVSQCRSLLRALIDSVDALPGGMQRTNAVLGRDLPSGRFVTAFFGILDASENAVHYISAGHGPLLHHRVAGDQRIELQASTVPLGIIPAIDATPPEPIRLDPGDTLLLITDGFFEWADPDAEQYGTDRIFDLVRDHPDTPAAELIARLHEAVVAFGRGTPQADDLTAIIVRRL